MKPDQLPKALTGLAVAVLFLTLVAIIMVPKADPKEAVDKLKRQTSKDRVATAIAEKDSKDAETVINLRAWSGTPGTIAPVARERLRAIAKKDSVSLTSFRPQKQNDNGELSQLPFVATVEGAYPDVVRFVRDAEAPATKLAVNLVQIANLDDTTSRVNATVGFLAYLAPPVEETPKAPVKKNG
ncbi:hypothetical protein BH11ARM2_BH11ARM2_24290 [soil metagenome]